MESSGNVVLEGSFVAMVTPFKSDGSIDYDRIAELVEFHISSGTNGIVPCGWSEHGKGYHLSRPLHACSGTPALRC